MPEPSPRRFARGVGFQAAGRLLQGLSAWGTLVVLTAVLDFEGIGLYDSYFALYLLLDALVDGGSGLALVRRASATAAELRPALRSALRFRAASAVLAGAAATLYQLLDPRVGAADLWAWLCVPLFFAQLPGTLNACYHLKLQFGFPSAVRSVCAGLSLVAAVALAAAGVRAPSVFLFTTLAGRAAANLVIGWGGLRLLEQAPPARAGGSPGFYRESIALGAGGVFREAYGRLDVLLLRWLVGVEAAGIYAPARRTLSLALLFPSFLLSVAFPPLAARAVHDHAAFRSATLRLARGLALVAVPAALLSLPLVPWYLGLFGERFAEASGALRILAVAAAAAWPGMVFVTALITAGAARAALAVSALGLVLATALSLALIPEHGMEGAALARAAAEAAVLAASAAAALGRTTRRRRAHGLTD